MTPAFDPGAILTDTVNQAESRLGSAGWLALALVGGLLLVAFSSSSKRRR
jgi:hypothetical protein